MLLANLLLNAPLIGKLRLLTKLWVYNVDMSCLVYGLMNAKSFEQIGMLDLPISQMLIVLHLLEEIGFLVIHVILLVLLWRVNLLEFILLNRHGIF